MSPPLPKRELFRGALRGLLPPEWDALLNKLRVTLGIRFSKHYNAVSSTDLIAAIVTKVLHDHAEEIESAYIEAQRNLAVSGVETALGPRVSETLGLPDVPRNAQDNPLGQDTKRNLKHKRNQKNKGARIAAARAGSLEAGAGNGSLPGGVPGKRGQGGRPDVGHVSGPPVDMDAFANQLADQIFAERKPE